MKNLLIIGARGFGREIYDLAQCCPDNGVKWTIKGFLDDNSNALDGLDDYPPIIGSVEDYVPQPEDVFVSGLGSVVYKEKYVNMILEKGGEFVNLIHSTALVGKNIKMGKGVCLFGSVYLTADIMVGDFVTIQSLVILGHDVEVGKWSHITAFTFVGGYTKIGESVTVYAGAKIIDRRKIGAGSTVGAGSVVIRNVKPGTTVFGNPAREI